MVVARQLAYLVYVKTSSLVKVLYHLYIFLATFLLLYNIHLHKFQHFLHIIILAALTQGISTTRHFLQPQVFSFISTT